MPSSQVLPLPSCAIFRQAGLTVLLGAADKTGTLTKNQMHVQNIATISNEYTTVEARDCVVRSGEEAEGIKAMTAITAICNDAQFEPGQDQVPLTEKKVNGDATGRSMPEQDSSKAHQLI